MTNIEKQIELYRQELLKYAQEHGSVYSGDENGFQQLTEEIPDEEDAIYEQKEEMTEIEESKAPIKTERPMPNEYSGDEYEEEPSKAPTALPPLYASLEDFTSKNTKTGKLKVQAYSSEQVFPIRSARVTVEKSFGDGVHLFAENYTDIDGIVENIILPTKDKSLSLTPGNEIPYSTYTVTVSHPQFATIIFKNVPIFDAIESFQPAAMLPKSSASSTEEVIEEEPNL